MPKTGPGSEYSREIVTSAPAGGWKIDRGKREGGQIGGASLGWGGGDTVYDDKLDREAKGEGNSGEDPQVPAWRGGQSSVPERGMRVWKGKLFT